MSLSTTSKPKFSSSLSSFYIERERERREREKREREKRERKEREREKREREKREREKRERRERERSTIVKWSLGCLIYIVRSVYFV